MRISTKRTTEFKQLIRVNNDHFDAYYAKPMRLGSIVRRNGSWYTEDDSRFYSARQALLYLIKQMEKGQALPSKREPAIIRPKVEPRKELMKQQPTPDSKELNSYFNQFLEFILAKQKERLTVDERRFKR